MYKLKDFRERIRELYRTSSPYDTRKRPTQRDLADAIGLNQSELSNRLNGTKGARLSSRDARAIVTALAEWGAISSRQQADELLAMLDYAPFSNADWATTPLNTLSATDPATITEPVNTPTPRHNLPLLLTSFVGRRHESDEVENILGAARLLTLTGTGGCGKTRLALEVAARVADKFADGVWLVELASLNDCQLLPLALASVFGLAEQANQTLTEQLVQFLRPKQALLLFDNCEHLIEGAAQLVHMLLLACPNIRILATSREPLRIPAEVSYRVPSLSLPEPHIKTSPYTLNRYEAIKLLLERAKANLPNFKLTFANAQAVRELCTRLDGIPLALELAAARLSMMSVEQLCALLDDRFRLLTQGLRTNLARQQTLRATIDWSYDLLTPAEQMLFRRLAIFTAGFTLEAAEQVCADEALPAAAVLGLLGNLVDKSLVNSIEHGGVVRFSLLETIREYASEKLTTTGDSAALYQRHADFYLQQVELAAPELQSEQQATWLARLEREHDNIRAALTWLLAHHAATQASRMVVGIWLFWYMRGYLSEGRKFLEATLAMKAQLPAELLAETLHAAGTLAWSQSDYPIARAYLTESIEISTALGNHRRRAVTLSNLGNVLSSQGDYAAAQTCYHQCLAIRRELGDQQGIAAALNNLATALVAEDDYLTAKSLCEESLSLFQQTGNVRGIATLLNNLGDIVMRLGDYPTASQFNLRSLALRRELGDRYGIAAVLHSLGELAYLQADYPTAYAYYEESLALHREMDDLQGIAELITGIAAVLAQQGLAEAATQLLSATIALHSSIGAPLPASEHRRHEQALTLVHASIDADTFERAWSAGAALDFAAAADYALHILPH